MIIKNIWPFPDYIESPSMSMYKHEEDEEVEELDWNEVPEEIKALLGDDNQQ